MVFDLDVGVMDWECEDPGYTDPPEEESEEENERE